MNSSAFGRIVWKECRAQFSLWLALVLGALLLQSTILFSANASGAMMPVAAVTFVLTACFAVACLALLFAGETEEGTRDWLQQLPIRPVTLVSAKLTFAILGVATFFAATWGTAAVAAVLSGRSAAALFRIDLSGVRFGSILGLTAWGLLFSLRCRRVLSVLLGAVVAEIITVTVTDGIYGPSHSPYFGGSPQSIDELRNVTYFAVVAIVLAVDLVLAWRWAAAGAGATTTSSRQIRALSLPLGQWRTTKWLSLVAWASRRGSPSARETAVLVWREARTAVPFAVAWLLLGLLVTDLLSIGTQPGNFRHQRPLQVLFLIATPAICGLLTCLGDQRQQAFRFLGERGVSPARIWWVKQCIWLLLAVVISLLFVRWDSAAVERLRRSGPTNDMTLFVTWISTVHVPTEERESAFNRPADVSLQIQFLWSLGLVLFAAGQCASFWIRRTVLAFGAMVIAVPLLISWHRLLVFGDIPLSLGSWPLSFALLAATLCSAGVWLRGCDSWKLRFLRLAAIALPVCAATTAAAAHRAYSVPKPVFSQELANAVQASDAGFDNYDTGWSGHWERVLANFRSVSFAVVNRNTIPLTQQQQIRQELIELGQQINGPHGQLDPLLMSPDKQVTVQQIGVLLANPPTNEPATAEGDGASAVMQSLDAPVVQAEPPEPIIESLEEQWRAYEAGLRITRYLSGECLSSEQWIDCTRARVPLLTAIRTWSQRADQTPAALQQAFDFLATDQAPTGTREMAINRYVFYSQLLEQRGRKWQELHRQLGKLAGFGSEYAVMVGAVYPPFERERIQRLLGHITADFLNGRTTYMNALNQDGEQLRRWAASTGGMPVNVNADLYSVNFTGQHVPGSMDAEAQRIHMIQAGTTLIVALQQHRLVHGELPASLGDVILPGLTGVVSDPYTNAPFGYEPQGLPADLYLANGQIIPAGQPLIWSAGSGRGRLVQALQPISFGRDGGLEIPRGAYYTTGQGLSSVATEFFSRKPTPNEIEFVNATFPQW